MSKERLKEIERLRGIDRRLIAFEHTDWLIEQAKRVEELESQVENWQKGRYLAVSTIDKERELKKRVQELKEENKQIRQMKYHEAYEQGKFDTNMKVWYEIPKLEQQNKRYRELLNKVAYEDIDFKQTVNIVREYLEGEE